jgi:hypothetical protein
MHSLQPFFSLLLNTLDTPHVSTAINVMDDEQIVVQDSLDDEQILVKDSLASIERQSTSQQDIPLVVFASNRNYFDNPITFQELWKARPSSGSNSRRPCPDCVGPPIVTPPRFWSRPSTPSGIQPLVPESHLTRSSSNTSPKRIRITKYWRRRLPRELMSEFEFIINVPSPTYPDAIDIFRDLRVRDLLAIRERSQYPLNVQTQVANLIFCPLERLSAAFQVSALFVSAETHLLNTLLLDYYIEAKSRYNETFPR